MDERKTREDTMAEVLDESHHPVRRGRLAKFVHADHRYVLLGTSVVALLGMPVTLSLPLIDAVQKI